MEQHHETVEPWSPVEVGIGIDFGMTYSGAAIAYRGLDGIMNLENVPIRGSANAPKFPTLVFVSDDRRTIAVGNDAFSPTVPGKVYELFKLWLGEAWTDPDGRVPDVKFLVTQVLKAIKEDVDEYLTIRHGFREPRTRRRYVFTYPGTWRPARLLAFKMAIKDAGLPESPDSLMLDEATATAIAVAKRGIQPEILGHQDPTLVCDIGGGTTDFAVVQATTTGLVRMKHAPGGDQLLGMSNLDKLIALVVARKLKMVGPSVPALDKLIVMGAGLETTWKEFAAAPAWKSELLKQSEDLKIRAFNIWQRFRGDVINTADHQFTELTMEDVQPFVDGMLTTLEGDVQRYLREVSAHGGVTLAQIRYVIVGGGGSALPDVHQHLQRLMPAAKVLTIGTSIATSLVQAGAAFHALDPTIYDRRVATSYGIRVGRPEKPSYDVPADEIAQGEDDRGNDIPYYPYYEIFLKRNDIVRPEPVTRFLTPIRRNQAAVTFDVLCGEDDNPLVNRRIGTLKMPLDPGTPKDYPLEVSVTIGTDALLKVSVKDKKGKLIHNAFQWKVDLD